MSSPLRPRLPLGALCAAAMVCLSGSSVARADRILVYQKLNNDPFMGDMAGPSAVSVLTGLGHDVTAATSLTATLPADLSVFDTVWVISLVPPTGPEETQLVDFVNAGGGLYLTGERPCCENVNGHIQAVLNRLITSTTRIGRSGDGGDVFDAAPGDPHRITTTPNAVPRWLAGEAGLMSMIDPAHQVYRNASGVGAAAWAGEDLEQGGGCVYVAMDLSFWFPTQHPEQDKAALAANIERFLVTCDDSDSDGTTDPAERAAGTMLSDPDSDDDGLCDGYGAVTGVCIPGERVLTDSDMDGVQDPLDTDDDNDGIPTSVEAPAHALGGDGDRVPAWLDVDSDGDNRLDRVEGTADRDGDGIPGFVDLGDEPENCDEDADCVVFAGEPVCNMDTGFCAAGAGPADAGVTDAGGTDAAAPDGALGDAGPTRADAAAPLEAGAPGRDASGASDGGVLQGGPDASSPTREVNDGCGCAVSRPVPAWEAAAASMTLAWLGAVLRRRRDRRTAA